ncbi:MAG: G5 domain-containing protein [Armatimonadetes bacterium]|nr:G5 domain-containing protein [Armatimonadota bacterium]
MAEVQFLRALALLFFIVALVALLALRVGGCRGPARAIVINGETVCYVRDEGAAEQVRRKLIEQAKGDLTGDASIEEKWEVVRPKVVPVDEAVKQLQGRVHVQLEAVGIEVNGQIIAYLPTESEAKRVLDMVKQHYVPEGERLLEPPKFREKVRLVPATTRPEKVEHDLQKAVDKLLAAGGERTYTVRAGDYPAAVAKRFGMSLKQLYALNPGIKGRDLKVGQKLRIVSKEPRLTVVTVREIKVRKEIPPPEEPVETDALLKGEKRVVREGEPGEKVLTLRAVFENDKRIKAQILEDRTIKKPVSRRVMVGTREPTPTTPSTGGASRDSAGH